MDLDAKFLAGEDYLDEKRRAAGLGVSAEERLRLLIEEASESLPGMRPGSDFAIVAGEPYLADGLVFGYPIVPRAKIIPSPDSCDKLRLDAERGHLHEYGMRRDRHAAGSSEIDRSGMSPDPISIARADFIADTSFSIRVRLSRVRANVHAAGYILAP
jgi:hypothetical protein